MNNIMTENVGRFLDETKDTINSRIAEYKELCKDDLGVLHLYFLVKHRDSLSFNSSNSGFRSQLYNYANSVCVVYGLDFKKLNQTLGEVHKKYQNSPDHFDNVNEAVLNIISSIRSRFNNTVYNDKTELKNEEHTEDNFKEHVDVSHDKVDLYNLYYNEFVDGKIVFEEKVRGVCSISNYILRDTYNQNVLLYNTYRFKSLLKDKADNAIYYDEAYMITDEIGERDKNIGCYIAKLSDMSSDYKYVVIPQGCGYLNNKHGLYNTSIPRYFNSFDETCKFATCLLTEFYKLKYIM